MNYNVRKFLSKIGVYLCAVMLLNAISPCISFATDSNIANIENDTIINEYVHTSYGIIYSKYSLTEDNNLSKNLFLNDVCIAEGIIDFCVDNQYVAYSSDNALCLYDIQNGISNNVCTDVQLRDLVLYSNYIYGVNDSGGISQLYVVDLQNNELIKTNYTNVNSFTVSNDRLNIDMKLPTSKLEEVSTDKIDVSAYSAVAGADEINDTNMGLDNILNNNNDNTISLFSNSKANMPILMGSVTLSSLQPAMFVMDTLYVTQGTHGSTNYPNAMAFDFDGSLGETPASDVYAPFDAKVIYKSDDKAGNCHAVFIESSDIVQYANGNSGHMTVMVMHDEDISDVTVGSNLKQGQVFYQEGNYGWSKGQHLHLECRKGKTGLYNTSALFNYRGDINPNDALYLYSNTNVQNKGGYTWRIWSGSVIPEVPSYTEVPSNPNNLKSDKLVYDSSESIMLSWDSVLGATHYWVYMWKDGVQLYGTDMGNSTSFTSSPTSPGNYTFIVRAGNSVGYSDGVSYNFTVTDVPVTNAWLKVDKYNIAINKEVTFTYHADNAEYYELWLFRNGICLGNTPLPLTGSYTTKFDTAGYYQAYVSSSNSSGYIDSGKIEFNIYDNVPPDPWIYIEKDTLVVGEEVRFVYNASHVTHFSLGINRYNERIVSEYRGWNETTYTTSFDKSGTYTAYISAYNDYGYADSRKIIFTVHDKTIQNLGEKFYGKILNKACWKPTQNDNSLLKLCKEKGHSNELWRFVRQPDGSYEILSCTTGEYLIANSESKILIGNTTENTNKQWFIYNFGNGIILKPKSSEDVLTLDGGNTEIGTKIVLSPFSGNSSQIFNVYQGYDVQLTAPTLSIDAIKYDKVSFNWNSVSSLSNYKIKVYSVEDLNNPIYVDDVSIDTTSYTLKLPTGNYIASVTAYNYYQGCQSNEVKFNLTAPVSTKVTKKDNTLTFTSILNVNEAENATVLLGLYDKNNTMLNIVKDVYKNKVIFNIPYQKDIEYAKVMVWNGLSGLKPLCEAEVIPNSKFIVE